MPQPSPIRAEHLRAVLSYTYHTTAETVTLDFDTLNALIWLAAHAPASVKRKWIKHQRAQSAPC